MSVSTKPRGIFGHTDTQSCVSQQESWGGKKSEIQYCEKLRKICSIQGYKPTTKVLIKCPLLRNQVSIILQRLKKSSHAIVQISNGILPTRVCPKHKKSAQVEKAVRFTNFMLYPTASNICQEYHLNLLTFLSPSWTTNPVILVIIRLTIHFIFWDPVIIIFTIIMAWHDQGWAFFYRDILRKQYIASFGNIRKYRDTKGYYDIFYDIFYAWY